MPCSPNDVSIDIPDGPSGPSIPNFGISFSPKIPYFDIFPKGFPQSLLDLLNQLQMLIPPGALLGPLSVNFGKDIMDAIMKMLDQFMPFLMMYKFFLPILKMILCIIEVLCAIKNPFKVIKALKKLFRNCLPDFLNLFPLFALLMMIISLLMLLLALIEYIIKQILKYIEMILRNIRMLNKALSNANESSILAIAKKLGATLCIFQNLFVLLTIFAIIIQIFRDILSLIFSIPPCDDSDPSDEDGCCTPDVCPDIIKSNYTRSTGFLQYYNALGITLAAPVPTLFPPAYIRNESWQIYDPAQTIKQAFINIVDAYDVTISPKPVFFPTDVTYTASTEPKQAAYLIDLRLLYNPSGWGRGGQLRWIRFNDCIVQYQPTRNLINYDSSTTNVNNGVLQLLGGRGFEDDGTTILTGYDKDGTTPIDAQATLANFIHKKDKLAEIPPVATPTDGTLFAAVEYTFKPSHAVLMGKDLVTAGCLPDFRQDQLYIQEFVSGDAAAKTAQAQGALERALAVDAPTQDAIKKEALNSLEKLNGFIDPNMRNAVQQGVDALKNANGFPDPAAAQDALIAATNALKSNLTEAGVAQFQATCMAALNKLKEDANKSLEKMIGIAVDACKSNFSIVPTKQFTTRPIEISVNLKEKNTQPITKGLPLLVANNIAAKLKSHLTFGKATNFVYDGYQTFKANIFSDVPGKGSIMVSFDDNIFCADNIPSSSTGEMTHTLQSLDYQFIYAPAGEPIDLNILGDLAAAAVSINTTDLKAIDDAKLAANNKAKAISNAAANIVDQIMSSSSAASVASASGIGSETQPRRDETDESILGDNSGKDGS